jgi:23S rRNA (cytosine1962-C5)-methyltransferase
MPGFAVDAYGGYLVVHVLDAEALDRAPFVEAALDSVFVPRGIVRKLRYKQKGRGRVEETVVRGGKPPGVLTVLEEGVPLEVELLGGFHTGLFTDMREEHLRMRRLADDRRVLNTFAYTGAFSVAAALGGASEVTSVDVVAKALERAKRNFRLAGLDAGSYRFARMEAREYLRMARRRGWRFDAIVLDPPTFASFKSGTWALKKDYPELLDLALSVLEKEGLLWIAANTETLSELRLDAFVRGAVERSERSAQTVAVSGLPPDYPTLAERPDSRYLKVHVLRVS